MSVKENIIYWTMQGPHFALQGYENVYFVYILHRIMLLIS